MSLLQNLSRLKVLLLICVAQNRDFLNCGVPLDSLGLLEEGGEGEGFQKVERFACVTHFFSLKAVFFLKFMLV